MGDTTREPNEEENAIDVRTSDQENKVDELPVNVHTTRGIHFSSPTLHSRPIEPIFWRQLFLFQIVTLFFYLDPLIYYLSSQYEQKNFFTLA